jgi:Spy/CpxP family protein refolding chaperone
MLVRPVLSLIALGSALLGASVAASAQSAPYPLPSAPAAAVPQNQAPQRHHRRNRMREALQQLDLSSDQRKQIASMMRSFRASRQSATPMTRRQLRSNIEGVLSPQQRSQFDLLMRHRRPPAANVAPAST